MRKNSPTVDEVIERYKKNIHIWRIAAKNDFQIMSESDYLNDIQQEFYEGWSREDFVSVINEMKKHGG